MVAAGKDGGELMAEDVSAASRTAPRPPRASRVFTVGERQMITSTVKLLTAAGCADAARLLATGLNHVDAPPRVVVVGEVKRGKSTLVNALAGRQVSPTGIGVVTFCPIQLEPPLPERPVGTGHLVFRDGTTGPTMPIDDLLPLLDPARPEPVSQTGGPAAAVVSVDQSLLDGLVLVDTPGVGGLNEAHIRATLAALKEATAVLFIAEGGQPLTKPELDFLSEAAERVEFVLFALSKTDLTDAWREIEQENRRLLRQHAPRFADATWYPVAGELATLAWDPAVSPEDARFLLEGSRILELAEGLQQVSTHANTAYAANALRHGMAGLEIVDAGLAVELSALEDPAVLPSIDAERERLAVLVDRRDFGLQFDIPAEIAELRAEVAAQVEQQRKEITARLVRQLEEIERSRTWSARLAGRLGGAGPDPGAERRFEAELDAELAALAALVGERLTEGMARITRLAFEGLPSPELDLPQPVIVPDPAAILRSGSETADDRPKVARAGIVQELVAVGTTVLTGLLLFHNPAFGLVSAPATLFRLFSRSGQGRQQQLALELRESMLGVQQTTLRDIDKAINDFRAGLYRALKTELTRNLEDLQRAIASADRSAAEQRRRVQAITAERDQLAERVGVLETVRERILAAAGTPDGVAASKDQTHSPRSTS